jgi:two-component system, NarL family, response regulator LiaR
MITVSVVEDNPQYQDALVQCIRENEGFHLVASYASAEKAIADLPQKPPDIVIVDIQLPGLSGLDMVRVLKGKLSSTEYLICTVQDDSETVFDALRAGASGYILKDATCSQILQAVTELTKGGAPMSPFIARKVIGSFRTDINDKNDTLSEREREVLQLLSKGLLYKEIAEQLSISRETVKKHLKNVYQKLHVQNKIEALNKLRLL